MQVTAKTKQSTLCINISKPNSNYLFDSKTASSLDAGGFFMPLAGITCDSDNF
jgi:hypothetical protein